LTTQLSLNGSATERLSKRQSRREQSKASFEHEESRPIPTLPTALSDASELVILSNASLLNNIALDVLSTFLLELAAKIEKIGGITSGWFNLMP
jgi:hypothetical protein